MCFRITSNILHLLKVDKTGPGWCPLHVLGIVSIEASDNTEHFTSVSLILNQNMKRILHISKFISWSHSTTSHTHTRTHSRAHANGHGRGAPALHDTFSLASRELWGSRRLVYSPLRKHCPLLGKKRNLHNDKSDTDVILKAKSMDYEPPTHILNW